MTQQNEAIRLAVEALTNAFLTWKLPESVCADKCASMVGYQYPRSGTNLLSYAEAKAFFEHAVECGLLRPLLDQTSAGVGDGGYGIIDAIEWADGVAGALGSEYASRVTDEEIAVAMAIKSALTQADKPADSFVAAGEWAIVPKRLSLPMAQAVENNIDGEGNLYDCWYSMMLNAAPQPPDEYLAGRWLPVDTAPKQNGERVLLALIEDERWLWVTIGWWNKKSKAWWHNPDGRLIPPSHWMPLPSTQSALSGNPAPRPEIVRPGPDSCATVAADKGYPYQDHMEAFEKRLVEPADKDELRDRITKALLNHRLSHTQDDDGNGFPLIDALSCKHKTIKEGIEECHSLADEIAAEISALSGSDGRE